MLSRADREMPKGHALFSLYTHDTHCFLSRSGSNPIWIKSSHHAWLSPMLVAAGREMALHYARLGAEVALVARNKEKLEQVSMYTCVCILVFGGGGGFFFVSFFFSFFDQANKIHSYYSLFAGDCSLICLLVHLAVWLSLYYFYSLPYGLLNCVFFSKLDGDVSCGWKYIRLT